MVTRVELEAEGPTVVIVGDDGPEVLTDDGPEVTLAVTEDDAGGVPQIQTQLGGLVGAGGVGPAEVLCPGDVDCPDVPGDEVVVELRRWGTNPLPVEVGPAEVLWPGDVDCPGDVDGPDVPADVTELDRGVDELEGSL